MKTEKTKKDSRIALANPSLDSSGNISFLLPLESNQLCHIYDDIDFSISDQIMQVDSEISKEEYYLHKELSEQFTPKKIQNEILASSYERLVDQGKQISQNRILRCWNCGTYLGFGLKGEKYKLMEANFCRDRLCPMCQRRMSLKMFSQISKCMDRLFSSDHPYGKLKIAFATFTIQNCEFDQLGNAIDSITNGFHKLTHDQRKLFRSGAIAGTVRALEITFNKKTNTWHPHLHCIFAMTQKYFEGRSKLYMTTKQWSEAWKNCIKSDYYPIVDIRMVKNYNPDKKQNFTLEDLQSGVREVAKYSVKGSDFIDPLDLELTDHKISVLMDALAGRRLYGFTGCFSKIRKELKLDDIESGDLINTDSEELNLELVQQIVRFRWNGFGYVPI